MWRISWVLTLVFLVSGLRAEDEWLTFENCEFVADAYFDGDSFSLKTRAKGAKRAYTYIFRLYGVDCPETSASQEPARVAEQSEWFRTGGNQVLEWGRVAAEYVAERLASGKITVHTKKAEARGQSKKSRYYAVVEVDGSDLALELVENGLARAFGQRVAFQRFSPEAFMRQYERRERTARSQKAGIWSGMLPPP